MKIPFLYLLLCLAISGCHMGPQIENLEYARRPEGITTSIELRNGIDERKRVEGELLEVRKEGLLLNARETGEASVVKRHVVFVPYTAMINVRLEKVKLDVLDNKHTWNESAASTSSLEHDRETLRLLSRFPQGLSRPLLKELLAAEGQTTVDVIGGETGSLFE
jgi:hypothetical protein